MRKTALFILAVLTTCSLGAEPYPSNWIKFTLGEYVYDIQSGQIPSNTPEEIYISQLQDLCRVNVAKQLEVILYDKSTLQKHSLNGKTDIEYSAHTEYETEMNLQMLQTESFVDTHQRRIYAIAYINKVEAGEYYSNQIQINYDKIQSSLTIVDYLIAQKEFLKSGEELKKAKKEYITTNDYYKWLLIYGCNETKIKELFSQGENLNQKIEQRLSYLSSSSVPIYMQCSGTLHDISYDEVVEKVKSNLGGYLCFFVEDFSQAEWIITLKLKEEIKNAHKKNFLTISISGSALCVGKQTTYALFRKETDTVPAKGEGYISAAEVILNRGDLLGDITNDIIDILKSK